jgi:hypothetical protein
MSPFLSSRPFVSRGYAAFSWLTGIPVCAQALDPHSVETGAVNGVEAGLRLIAGRLSEWLASGRASTTLDRDLRSRTFPSGNHHW